jgi:hypothetical protein
VVAAASGKIPRKGKQEGKEAGDGHVDSKNQLMRVVSYRPLGWLVLLAVLGGCEFIKRKKVTATESNSEKPIARVNETYLFQDDLKGIITTPLPPEDSVARVSAYIDNWVRKQLLIDRATRTITIDEADLERKMLDYRYSLIAYQYQNYYLQKSLTDSIRVEDIQRYYEEHIDNFILKRNIIQGTFVKVPKTAPRIDRIKALMTSTKTKDWAELRSYCLSFSSAYHLNDSTWLEFDQLVVNSPLAEIPNKVQFLRNYRFYETADDQAQYFLKIDNYKISDNVSPLEFVREDIKNILLNTRKVELIKQLEQEVYENGKQQKLFEIF